MYHTGRDDNEHRIILTSDYNFFVQVGFTLFTVVVKVEFEVPRSDKSKNVCLLSVLMRPGGTIPPRAGFLAGATRGPGGLPPSACPGAQRLHEGRVARSDGLVGNGRISSLDWIEGCEAQEPVYSVTLEACDALGSALAARGGKPGWR